MSKTLNLDTLKGFSPKVVNIDESLIKETVKEFNEEHHQEKKKKTKKESASHNFKEYEKKIKLLEEENKRLKQQSNDDNNPYQIKSRKLRNNFDKLIKAIEKESIEKKTEWPQLSTNKLRKVYKVTADSFKECLDYGLKNKIIERKEVSFSGDVKTWCYKIIKK